MADILPFVAPHDDGPTLSEFLDQTIAKWKAAMPLTYQLGVHSLYDYIEFKRGRRDFDFIVEAIWHEIKGLVVLYDIVANEAERKRMRKSFREIMTRRPIFLELYEPIRQRLREHKMFVRCGLDPPDEPRRKRNAAA
jgi:hypothetical protein